MSSEDKQAVIVSAIIIGVCLLIGLATGGYYIGKGSTRFKSDIRTVTVKGLVEKEVKADQAVWTLSFRRASENLKDAHARITADKELSVAFLKKQGFKEEEINLQPMKIVDKLARDYDSGQANERYRYVATSAVRVMTKNVGLVIKSLGETEKLLKAGVLLDGQMDGMANPRYMLTAFNELRPQLLAEATQNARLTAQQFASDSGAKIGKIRSANQGTIQIFGSDGNDESAYYSPTSTPVKKIRVVSTFEFELK